MNYEEALACSNEITSLLFHYCMRIQPTGALRRKEASVDPVEMIASPQVVETNSYWSTERSDLGGEAPGADRLEAGIRLLVAKGALNRVQNYADDSPLRESGQTLPYVLSYRQATVVIYRVVKPSDWGLEFLLHTGDDDFVRFLEGRVLQRGFTLNGGRIERDGRPSEAAEELDVFKLLGLDWVEPENRNRGFLARQGLL